VNQKTLERICERKLGKRARAKPAGYDVEKQREREMSDKMSYLPAENQFNYPSEHTRAKKESLFASPCSIYMEACSIILFRCKK
jgi:hypothetical protein